MADETLKKQDEEFQRNSDAYADALSSSTSAPNCGAKPDRNMELLRIQPDDPPAVAQMKRVGRDSILRHRAAMAAGDVRLLSGDGFTGFTERPVRRRE